MSNKREVVEVIKNFLALEEVEELEKCDNIIVRYDLDSMSFVSLIVYIEQEFSISIPDEKLEATNFTTVESIANLLDNIS